MEAEIEKLRAQVDAAREEFDLALWFYEAWRPAALDSNLHARMGSSYSTDTFLAIREALRREMLLAVARLWDTDKKAVRLTLISSLLADDSLIRTLADEGAKRFDWPGVADEIYSDFKQQADDVISVVRKYKAGGAKEAVLDNLIRERHEHLAHRQVQPSEMAISLATASDIEILFDDMSRVISTLLHVAKATGYDPIDTAEVFRRHSALFWENARGERTVGHPSYREVPAIPKVADDQPGSDDP
jgi:AbiU2